MKNGIIFPIYARSVGQVDAVVRDARQYLQFAERLTKSGAPVFLKIILLVIPDQDCGETARVLRGSIGRDRRTEVLEVIEVKGAHALNSAVERLSDQGMDNAFIVSQKYARFLSEESVRNACKAIEFGAKVVGMAVGDLADTVKRGQVSNVFAVWSISDLIEVGGFELESGAVEIAPIYRMWRRFGKCVGVVATHSGGKESLSSHGGRPGRLVEASIAEHTAIRKELGEFGVDLSFLTAIIKHRIGYTASRR